MAKFEMDTEFVRKLAQLLQETDLGEIELADGDKRIRVARPTVTVAAAPAAARPRPPLPPRPPAAAPAADADLGKHPGAVKSPMVGTAYLAPEPGKPNFVGDRRQGDRGPDAADHRGDEDLQSDQGAQGRHGDADPDRQRPAGGVRRSR